MGVKTQLKINGELKDVEIEGGEITIIEPEKKATGWERAEKGTNYIYISVKAGLCPETDVYVALDNVMFRAANYFTNEELAENISRMQTIQRQLFRWQAENDVPIERSLWFCTYSINYYEGTGIKAYNYPGDERSSFLPFFSSIEKAEECIRAFKDELTWLFTEFRWRMDG